MDEQELTHFIWDLVDDTIEHVFLRFPEAYEMRYKVYKRLSEEFLELSLSLELG